jgi:hypothetical protein
MSYTVQSINIDFAQDRATVHVMDQTSGDWVNCSVKINTPGNQGETALKQLARAAARQALQQAMAVL